MEITSNLQRAIENLNFSDIFIHNISCAHLSSDPGLSNFDSLTIKLKHQVSKSTVLQDNHHNDRAIRIFIDLGAIWVDKESKEVFSKIEVTYVLQYDLKSPLEKDCIDEFALKNASYHVWPYWREFLSSTCDRMNLPKLILPAKQLKHHSVKNEES
jgi:hypothetical protein